MIVLVIILLLVYSVLEKYNDEIIFIWQKAFRPGFLETISNMSELEVLRNYIWNERIPIVIILIVIVNLYQGFTSKTKEKENYLGCESFTDFLIRFNKRKNPIRSGLLVSSALVLLYQIFKQIRYNYGFPFIYGPLFIVFPVIYIVWDFISSVLLWNKSNKIIKENEKTK